MTDFGRSSRTCSVKVQSCARAARRYVIAPLLPLAVAWLGVLACKDNPPDLTLPTPKEPEVYSASASPSASTTATVATAAPDDVFPMSDEAISALVNPKNSPEYTGPTGGVEGTLHVVGDKPVMRALEGVVKGCENAQKVHGPTYRAGPKGELADALVAVIGYKGFVRPTRDDKVVTIRNCAIEPTAIDINLGQRLMIANADDQVYMPQTAAKSYVGRLVVKDQSPVPVFFTAPAAYLLAWIMGTSPASGYPTAIVYVLPSALHTTTSLDGKFRITGIPVGKARVTASHLDMKEEGVDFDVKAGEVTKIDLTLTYKAPSTKPSASTTVKPSPIK